MTSNRSALREVKAIGFILYILLSNLMGCSSDNTSNRNTNSIEDKWRESLNDGEGVISEAKTPDGTILMSYLLDGNCYLRIGELDLSAVVKNKSIYAESAESKLQVEFVDFNEIFVTQVFIFDGEVTNRDKIFKETIEYSLIAQTLAFYNEIPFSITSLATNITNNYKEDPAKIEIEDSYGTSNTESGSFDHMTKEARKNLNSWRPDNPFMPDSKKVLFEVKGSCKDNVSFDKWLYNGCMGWSTSMTFHGGNTGSIEYKAFDNNGVLIDEDRLIIKAKSLRPGQSSKVKVISYDAEEIENITIIVYCSNQKRSILTEFVR